MLHGSIVMGHVLPKFNTGHWSNFTETCSLTLQDELESFVQKELSPLAEVLERHAERHLYQLPPRSKGLKLGKVLEVVESQKFRA